jgi:hypothetical protein
MGRSPRIIPPLVMTNNNVLEDIWATEVMKRLELDVAEAKDNLLTAKISQSFYANCFHANDFPLESGDHVLLSTLNRHWEYKRKGQV